MNALRLLVVGLVALLMPIAAEAFVVRVAYLPGGEPSNVTVNQMERVINQVIREWEQHSHGRITARYEGLIGSQTYEGSDLVVVKWRSGLPSNNCARTCRWGTISCTGDLYSGHIQLNSNYGYTATVFSTVTRCVSIQAVLMHELGHLFFDAAGHWQDTIMSVTTNVPGLPNIADISLRHLWSNDDGNFTNDDYFPLRTRGIRFEEVSASSHNSLGVQSDFTANTFVPATPVAITAGDGEQTHHNYALAWGGYGSGTTGQPGIAVRRGDGSQWQTTFLPAGSSGALNERRTFRRPCITVSDRGIDFYVMWSSDNQVSESAGAPIWTGARAIFAMESHDRGATWSDPAQVGGAYTRNGISCSLDRTGGRVVAAYQGSGEDGVWITHRPANSSTLGQWSAPAQLSGGGFDVVPFTSGIPYVAFDRFSTSAGGWLSWDQSSDLQTHVAPIAWNGSMYEITGVHALRNSPVGWPLVTETQIRSSPILQFEGADLLFFGTAIAGNTQCAFWQWHMYSGGGFFNNINTTFGPGSSFRYSGAASSLNFFQYGTAGVVVQNP